MRPPPIKPRIDAFHWHEILHTTHVLLTTFEAHVEEHRATQSDPELKKLASNVSDAMAALYQAIGSVDRG